MKAIVYGDDIHALIAAYMLSWRYDTKLFSLPIWEAVDLGDPDIVTRDIRDRFAPVRARESFKSMLASLGVREPERYRMKTGYLDRNGEFTIPDDGFKAQYHTKTRRTLVDPRGPKNNVNYGLSEAFAAPGKHHVYSYDSLEFTDEMIGQIADRSILVKSTPTWIDFEDRVLYTEHREHKYDLLFHSRPIDPLLDKWSPLGDAGCRMMTVMHLYKVWNNERPFFEYDVIYPLHTSDISRISYRNGWWNCEAHGDHDHASVLRDLDLIFGSSCEVENTIQTIPGLCLPLTGWDKRTPKHVIPIGQYGKWNDRITMDITTQTITSYLRK